VFYGDRERVLAVWDYTELRHPHPYLVEIRPAALRSALARRLAELEVEAPRLACEVVGVMLDGNTVVGVRYRDPAGREIELEAGCVVGADGPDSVVRTAAGIECRRFATPDSYLLGTVDVAEDGDELAVYLGRGYGDGVVPLRDGTYFWDRVTPENRAAVEAQDVAGWRRVYEQRLPPGSELPAAVTAWEQLTVVDVRPFWVKQQVVDGMALAGDAAGVVHPHSAMGANLALEDAVALSNMLRSHAGDHPIPRRLLAAYGRPRQRRRRSHLLQSLLAAGLMDAPTPRWRAVRALNLACSRVGPARRAFLKLAIG
jgi:2-polyprenyl-6-methoxyphenol hydroxylase-like FAD-dependent oxidoreductase